MLKSDRARDNSDDQTGCKQDNRLARLLKPFYMEAKPKMSKNETVLIWPMAKTKKIRPRW